MKKGILSLTLLGAAFGAQAQISAGTTLLSGSIGYTQSENKFDNAQSNERNSKTQNFNLTPTIGYFVAENLAVGVNLDFTSTRVKGQDYTYSPFPPEVQYPGMIAYNFDNKSRTINAGIFARYYKFAGEKVAFFGQAGAGYSNLYTSAKSNSDFISNSYTNTNNGHRPQGFYGNILPGIAFFPTDKFALELTARGLSYNRVSAKIGTAANGEDDVKSIQNGFDLGFGLQDLRIGASFYLGR